MTIIDVQPVESDLNLNTTLDTTSLRPEERDNRSGQAEVLWIEGSLTVSF